MQLRLASLQLIVLRLSTLLVNRAPPLMPNPGFIIPGLLLEPLSPLADPELVFGAITLGTDFVPEFVLLVLPSPVLAARFLARISIQDLPIGLAVLVLGFAAGIVSAATL